MICSIAYLPHGWALILALLTNQANIVDSYPGKREGVGVDIYSLTATPVGRAGGCFHCALDLECC